jgi:hypothetical protein
MKGQSKTSKRYVVFKDIMFEQKLFITDKRSRKRCCLSYKLQKVSRLIERYNEEKKIHNLLRQDVIIMCGHDLFKYNIISKYLPKYFLSISKAIDHRMLPLVS